MADAAVPGRRAPLETRLPCPVCLGVQMEKVQLHGPAGTLVLDHCPRCGGVWFERGEVQQLGRHAPSDLWRLIPPRKSTPKPPCHGCSTPLDRAADTCAACGRKNELACPVCDERLTRRTHGPLTLDVCGTCRGVWFDHAELKSLWSLSLADVTSRGTSGAMTAGAIAGDVLLETLFWAPGLVIHAGAAATAGLGQLAGAASNVSFDGAAEVVGGAAEGVFASIVEIIQSFFE